MSKRGTFKIKFWTPEEEEIEILVTFPLGKGLLGLRGLKEAMRSEYQEEVLRELLEQGDESTVAAYDEFTIDRIEKGQG